MYRVAANTSQDIRPLPLVQAVPGRKKRKLTHCLLALDGSALTPELLSAAEAKCISGSGRVDILLTNAPKAPEALLHKLLIHMEKMNVEYRLSNAQGNLATLIPQYLRRHKTISQIMLASMPDLGESWQIQVSNLRYQGYGFCTLGGRLEN